MHKSYKSLPIRHDTLLPPFSQVIRFVVAIIAIVIPSMGLCADLTLSVNDEGEPVPMAEIIVLRADNRLMLNSGLTDKNGLYKQRLTDQKVEILIHKQGYSNLVLKNIYLMNKDLKKDVELVPVEFAGEQGNALASDGGCD